MSNIEKDKDNSEFPENINVIPINLQKDKEKEEARKQAKKLRKKLGNKEPIIVTKDNQIKKASELTFQEQEDEIVRCISDPIYFIETYLTIFDQTRGEGGEIVPFKLFNFQKDLINTYVQNRFVIANKYRQAGISTTTCAYIAWYIMFNKNRQVAIVADKLETARDELMSDVVDFIDSCPVWLKPKTGKVDGKNLKDTQKLKLYDNGSKLGAFSSKGLRGYTPTLLFWDETAWTERSDVFWTSAKPTLQTGGSGIMVSCVTKDSFIYTDRGIKQIGEFIPNDDGGAHIIDDYNVLGINKTRKGNIFFNNGFVDTLKISTSYNELETSYNHKYWAYTLRDKKYDWVKASDLSIGDYVSIQFGMNVWGNNDDCSDFKPTKNWRIKNPFRPKKITKDIAYLVGLYVGDGCGMKKNNKPNTYYGITLTSNDDMTPILNELNLPYYTNDDLHYDVSSLNLAEFLEYLGFDLSKKAKEKTLPSKVLEMSRDNIIAMVQGIMDADGWVNYDNEKNKIRVGIGLSSIDLIKQLRIVLGNFGILTNYQEVLTPPTEKVEVESMQYRITANNKHAYKYMTDIGFRFERKQNKILEYNNFDKGHVGVYDNIPTGREIIKNIYEHVKYYGIHKLLKEHKIYVKDIVQRKSEINSSPRITILNFINLFKEKIPKSVLDEYCGIISENIVWTPIKKIEKSKNHTYDFSLPNDNPEINEFNHSVIYNQMITHQTPNSLDPVFYKTFNAARKDPNHQFKAVELWWFNDPRYNKDLVWYKNKGKENEIVLEDRGMTDYKRIQLMDEGWEATSPWFESEIAGANGDMRKIAQEILCVFGDSLITIRNKKTGLVESIPIRDFYNRLESENLKCNVY